MRLRGAPLLGVALALMLPAGAAAADELIGTLKRVKDTRIVTIGHRDRSIPFSYIDPRGQPIGYAIELCNEIVDEISAELGGAPLSVRYKLVTSETRIPALLAGEIDLECGSTTSNAERARQVAFSPIYFVSGTKLVVRRDAGIASFRDLGGRRVVATAGTTNEAAVKEILEKRGIKAMLLGGKDHAQSFALLTAGEADAFAVDDVLGHGLIAMGRMHDTYTVVGDFLSYDPYGLMYRKDDPQLAAVVDRRFAKLASSRELRFLYEKWFLRRLPTGERLNIPVSPQLAGLFQALGLPE
jgi:glutamate/aspartate transport system substrate-binding protein